MTREIILLVLHIFCALSWAGCSVITDQKSSRIAYIICTVCWSICVGIDIAQFTLM